ncbi:unnamed protein product [Linum trigynum]|uniref:Uncharacterized protein n=1 Tax=Linum trigynum TaxID=586398 RepID=A0AAV2FEJ2_9ROSI
MTKQVLVRFNLGQYEDEVLCDVAPMHTAHVLLGRPWQFDRKVTHEGWMNCYKFRHQGKNFMLKPLSPNEVYEDQKQLESNRVSGKESRAQLWVQRIVGFNFMIFRKPQNEDFLPVTPAHNVPCSVPAKQSSVPYFLDEEEEGQWKPGITTEAFQEDSGTTKSEEKAPEWAVIDRTPPTTSIPELCSPVTM